MRELERLLKAAADRNRLRILHLLGIRKMCVCELSFVLGITQPSVSRHLKKLNYAGFISSQQDHFWTIYFLKEDSLRAKIILGCLMKWLKADAELKADTVKLKKTTRTKLCCTKKRR